MESCPGLGRNPGLSLSPVHRVTTYNPSLGYHHIDLRLAFPPMAFLTVVPAAVVTSEADRYFFLDGGRPHDMWTDSRRILGLKLPAERRAIGYAESELWFNIVAATTEPETIPRLLAREVSAATTAIDPSTESDADSSTETADLPESPGDASGDELQV